MQNKPKSTIVSKSEGTSFWQPGVKGNYVTIKTSPWNLASPKCTVFYHELPKGGIIPEHAHVDQEEILICLDGHGLVSIDGKDCPFNPHDVAFLAPESKHVIQSIGDTPLKMMVIISPGGLEERLKLMGVPKKDINEDPPESITSEIGKQDSHGVTRG